MKASADLVVYTARGHAVQGQLDHLQGVRGAGAGVVSEQELQGRGLGELGLESEAAGAVVELASESAEGGLENAVRERLNICLSGGERLADAFGELPSAGQDLKTAVVEGFRDCLEHPGKGWHSAAVVRREVGSAVERLAVGGHEDRHRPSALSGHGLYRGHVDRVDVGALLAIHLDADEAVVHHGGDMVVFERLTLHDVAPVARGVSDAEQYGDAAPAGLLECLVAPWVPVDGVFGVLEEVWACFFGESVGQFGVPRFRLFRVC